MATIWIAIEAHPDSDIGGVFLDEEKAKQFIIDTHSKAYNRDLYTLHAEEINDEEIFLAGNRINERRR